MRRPYPSRLAAALLAAAALAACGATPSRTLHETLSALGAQAPAPATGPRPSAGPPSCLASLRPPAILPAPGAMPAASFMAAIQRRGHLIAGVDQNTLLLAYLNPRDSTLEGFEISILRQIARAIFGRPKVVFRPITTAQRSDAVLSGTVDVVADAFTITCVRRRAVEFSVPYFDAHQAVLVPSNSPAQAIGALRNKKVCATRGSTSIEDVMSHPGLIPFPVAQRTDCLVAFQLGLVDAIASDDVILLGFKAQDPGTKILRERSRPAPYGMAISPTHADFVRFVNGVLARMRADGTWARIYGKWFQGAAPAPPAARYDG